VTIGNGVTIIRPKTFAQCYRLTEIYIPDSVTAIAGDAFEGCSNVKFICKPDSEAYYFAVENDIPYEFACEHTVTEIVGTTDVTCTEDGYTGDTVCSACGTVITAGKIIPSIGSHTWDDGAITTAPGLTTGGERTFTCTVCGETMTEVIEAVGKDFVIEDYVIIGYLGNGGDVIIPEGITAIGTQVFAFNNTIISVTIPEGVTTIGKGAFTFCENLETVVLPTTLETIEKGAFAFCDVLTGIEIPESVTELGVGAFSGCVSLGEVYVSDNVTVIGEDAFDGCATLTLRCYDTAPMAAYAEEDGVNYRLILCGDVDDNGTVSTADATLLSRKLSGGEISAEYGADYNRDGTVNAADITLLRRMLAGADL